MSFSTQVISLLELTHPANAGFLRVYSLHSYTLNFKSLALSAVIALSSLTGVAAQAAPTTCALRTAQDLEEFTCDHSVRTNANGHKVNDFTFFDGSTRYDLSIIFWMNRGEHKYAEVFMDGKRIAMSSYAAKNGAWCVSNNTTQFCYH